MTIVHTLFPKIDVFLSRDDTGSRIINYFHWTIKIPTHTVAVIIHQFDVCKKDISGETTLYSKQHESEYSAYFLSKYQIWFDKLEKYLNLPFKDHSVEVVAIPDGDEYTSNAGLIVYRYVLCVKINV